LFRNRGTDVHDPERSGGPSVIRHIEAKGEPHHSRESTFHN